MAYFLKRSNIKKGTYLQIYFSYYDPETKQTRHESHRAVGYVHELRESGIEDPIAYFQAEVDELNEDFKRKKEEEKYEVIGEKTPFFHLGYFPIKNINDALGVTNYLNLLQKVYGFRFNVYELLSSLLYARIIKPSSKHKTFHEILPNLFEQSDFSEDQLYRGLDFLGNEYQKIIEVYNHAIQHKYSFETEMTYYDGTNFYFEIDAEDDLRRKGKSKEGRVEPLIGMGMLLDARLIPLGMTLYAGNESEYPFLERTINEMKERHGIEGRTVRVADKGLNSAKTIFNTVKKGDGYIFSKPVLNLPEPEQAWVRLNRDYRAVYDEKDHLLYYIKECIDDFPYSFDLDDGSKKRFTMREKRIVSYNPKLAKKKREELKRQAEKATRLILSKAKRNEFGDCAKFVNFEAADKNGELNSKNVVLSMNKKLFDKHWNLAGFSLIVTSEIHLSAQEIYDGYHNLWRIEESFRMMKSELEARPVFLQKKERIFAHFLICYLALLLVRILQILILGDNHSYQSIIEFMRSFNVVRQSPNKYMNLMPNSRMVADIKQLTGLPIDHAGLNNSKIKRILNHRF